MSKTLPDPCYHPLHYEGARTRRRRSRCRPSLLLAACVISVLVTVGTTLALSRRLTGVPLPVVSESAAAELPSFWHGVYTEMHAARASNRLRVLETYVDHARRVGAAGLPVRLVPLFEDLMAFHPGQQRTAMDLIEPFLCPSEVAAEGDAPE